MKRDLPDQAWRAVFASPERTQINCRVPDGPRRAFTRRELLVVFATIAILIALFLSALANGKARSSRINCRRSLQAVALAFRMWSNDHGEKFPMSVSTNEGGSLEYANSVEVFRHFLAASNKLVSPKVLACRDDLARTRVADWSTFKNGNLSYFLALDVDERRPSMILSGDRNITTNGRLMSGIITLISNTPIRLADGIHKGYANIAFADGSAQQITEASSLRSVRQSPNLPARLALP
jgi:prepilin-type processing-associated H-X9-DG protein